MADNVAISAGTGTTVAADEVVDGILGTVKVQYVKLMDGTLDGTSKAAVGANGLAADVKASVLPTGASTSAAQTTGNNSLSSIDTKLPAQGQALAAASVPVVLTAAQITTLTPPTTVTRSEPVPVIPLPMSGATPLIWAALTDWLAVRAPIVFAPVGSALVMAVTAETVVMVPESTTVCRLVPVACVAVNELFVIEPIAFVPAGIEALRKAVPPPLVTRIVTGLLGVVPPTFLIRAYLNPAAFPR